MSTTLVTFLVQTPRSANTVRLLGSWDNFSKPYPMKRDVSLGSGHWRGCHSFTDIICDGQSVESADSSRDGALMQGGRYWYYYQLDEYVEFHNPKEPYTTSCPFLPGQQVNVLEVPVQVARNTWGSRRRSSSATSSTHFTLDPDDKYRTPKPPTSSEPEDNSGYGPKAKFRGRGRARAPILPEFMRPKSKSPESPESPCQIAENSGCDDEAMTAPPSRARSLRRAGSKTLRRWRSVVSRLPSRKSARNYMVVSPEDPLPPLPRPSTAGETEKLEHLDANRPGTARSDQSRAVPSQWSHSVPASLSDDEGFLGEAVKEFPTPPSAARSPTTVFSGGNLLAPVALEDDDETGTEQDEDELPVADGNVDIGASEPGKEVCCCDGEPHEPHGVFESTPQKSEAEDEQFYSASNSPQRAACHLHHSASAASSRTSGVFSSVVDSATVYTGHRSWRLSQPLTPTVSDFGEFAFQTTPASPHEPTEEDDNSYTGESGFYGYNLPEAEHASALTLRNLETANSKSSRGEMSHFEPHHRDEIIRAWNDGAGNHKSAMQELVDDLGYLGKMIA